MYNTAVSYNSRVLTELFHACHVTGQLEESDDLKFHYAVDPAVFYSLQCTRNNTHRPSIRLMYDAQCEVLSNLLFCFAVKVSLYLSLLQSIF